MKYQPGDDIIILHTKEEGKVIEVLNKTMLLVEVRGVRFPAYTDQVDFPYFHRFSKKNEQQQKKPSKKYIDEFPKKKIQIRKPIKKRRLAFFHSKIYDG